MHKNNLQIFLLKQDLPLSQVAHITLQSGHNKFVPSS